MDTGTWYQLLYKSTATRPVTDDVLRDIQAQAIRNNEALGVTGFLLHCGQDFVQLLEGPRSSVCDVLDRLVHDPRHRDLVLLHTATVANRSTPAWSMGVFTDDDRLTLPKPQGALAILLQVCRTHDWQSEQAREAIDRSLRTAA